MGDWLVFVAQFGPARALSKSRQEDGGRRKGAQGTKQFRDHLQHPRAASGWGTSVRELVASNHPPS